MAILRQKKNLNVIPGSSVQLTVHCSQSDAGSEIEFDLYAGSVPFEPQDASISVQGVRKDCTGFGPTACTYEGNAVIVVLDEAMTGVAGPAVCELTITEESGTVSTANFAIMVEPAAFPNGPIIDNSVDVYQQILAYVQGFQAAASADVAAEAAARQAADAELQSAIGTETANRTAADAFLQTEIDQIIAPTGEAPSAAEVENARIGADGTVYDTLGNAIRGQVGDLKSAIKSVNNGSLNVGVVTTDKLDAANNYYYKSNTFTQIGAQATYLAQAALYGSTPSVDSGFIDFDAITTGEDGLVACAIEVNGSSTHLGNQTIMSNMRTHFVFPYSITQVTATTIKVYIAYKGTQDTSRQFTIINPVVHVGSLEYPVIDGGNFSVAAGYSSFTSAASFDGLGYAQKTDLENLSFDNFDPIIYEGQSTVKERVSLDSVNSNNTISSTFNVTGDTTIGIDLDVTSNVGIGLRGNVVIAGATVTDNCVYDVPTRYIIKAKNKRKLHFDFSVSTSSYTQVSVYLGALKPTGASSGIVVNYENVTVTIGNNKYMPDVWVSANGSPSIVVSKNNHLPIERAVKSFPSKILFVGDSIADTHATPTAFPAWVASWTGCENINYAVASSGYSINAYYASATWGQENTRVCDMIEKAYTAGENPNFIVINAGTNDWDFAWDNYLQKRVPFGTLADVLLDSMDTPTFYFYVAKAIKTAINRYPTAKILVNTPTPRYQIVSDSVVNQHSENSYSHKTLTDYSNAINEICEYFSIPVLDMMHDSNMHLESSTAREYNTVDGLHPSSAYAGNVFAPMVISRIKQLL